GPELLSGRDGTPGLLQPRRTRLRTRDPKAAGVLAQPEGAQERQGQRQLIHSHPTSLPQVREGTERGQWHDSVPLSRRAGEGAERSEAGEGPAPALDFETAGGWR